MFNRSRRNLASWFALSMGSILIIFAGVVYYREVQDQLREFDLALYRKSKAIASEVLDRYQQDRWRVHLENVPFLDKNKLQLQNEISYIRWYNSQGQLVKAFGSRIPEHVTVNPGFQTIKIVDNPAQANSSIKGLRQVTLPILQNDFLIGYIQIATPIAHIQERLDRTRLFLSLGVPVTLSLIGITGWFLGGIAMQPIRRSYEQLQRFTADASHELRAPLAAILSNAQVGLLSPVVDGSQQRQRLENIVDITKSMSVLISNLLFLARHEGKLAPEVVKNIDLAILLQPLTNNYTAQADEQNLNFVVHPPEQSVNLTADPELLQQAIRNLLNNSFKYTLWWYSSPAVFHQSRRAIIQVEDNGIGIPDTDLPHIFERFYRVDTVRARQTGGFGLGLSIAQQIVQAHGGRITATSVVGQGSTFQIELPLK